jgi:hypothetical protein
VARATAPCRPEPPPARRQPTTGYFVGSFPRQTDYHVDFNSLRAAGDRQFGASVVSGGVRCAARPMPNSYR